MLDFLRKSSTSFWAWLILPALAAAFGSRLRDAVFEVWDPEVIGGHVRAVANNRTGALDWLEAELARRRGRWPRPRAGTGRPPRAGTARLPRGRGTACRRSPQRRETRVCVCVCVDGRAEARNVWYNRR